MYHSIVKVKKNLGPEFFKIKLQSLICNIANTSYAHAVLLCCLQAITSVYTSKNVAGCKKSARPIRSSIANRHVRPKTLISVEAKKLLIKNLLIVYSIFSQLCLALSLGHLFHTIIINKGGQVT